MRLYLQFSLFTELPLFWLFFPFFNKQMRWRYEWILLENQGRPGLGLLWIHTALESLFSLTHLPARPGREIFAGIVEAWKRELSFNAITATVPRNTNCLYLQPGQVRPWDIKAATSSKPRVVTGWACFASVGAVTWYTGALPEKGDAHKPSL